MSKVVAFDLDYEGFDGKKWEGKFVIRRPTIGSSLQVGTETARILGGMDGIDNETRGFAHALATVNVQGEKTPAWWENIEEEEDFGLLLAVFAKYTDEIRRFQKSTQPE